MTIAVSSIGDIIAISLLIKDIVVALNDCQGSSHNFQQLLTQLQSLETALLHVNLLIKKHETSPELNSLCFSVRQIAQNCHETAAPFLAHIKSYQRSLRPGGSGNVTRDVTRKVMWQVLRKDEVDKFYAEITAHTHSLNMMITMWGIDTIEYYGSKNQQALAAADELQRASDRIHEGLLQKILLRVDEAVAISKQARDILYENIYVSHLQWLKQLGRRLTTIMFQLQSFAFKTYSVVLAINRKLEWLCNECLLLDSPMILTDSLGRRLPIHLQFINSWDAFDAAMEVRFRNLPGHRKIVQKEFELQDIHKSQDIKRSWPWDGAVTCGQQLRMKMIFKMTDNYIRGTLCPGCRRRFENDEVHAHCPFCGLHFERMTASKAFLDTQWSNRMLRWAIERMNCTIPITTKHEDTLKRNLVVIEDTDYPHQFTGVEIQQSVYTLFDANAPDFTHLLRQESDDTPGTPLSSDETEYLLDVLFRSSTHFEM